MIMQNSDLFKDLSREATAEIAGIATAETHDKGSILFTRADPAKYFYTLLEGRVRLTIGRVGEIDYTASREGEVFGWSSMVDRACYTADAECVVPTKVVRIEKERLNGIFDKYPKDGTIFFKRLAAALVQRLLDNYNAFVSEGSLKGVTYGSGQVMGTGED
jgi:CRP/FNR family transcriptional regulator, cyclic AMP receptor protein